MHSPVNFRHVRVVNFLDHLLRCYLEEKNLRELHREAIAVRLGSRDTFMPGLSYFTKAQTSRLGETHATFAPTFVVEVLSVSTAHIDTGRKFAAYEQHGVQEYWILDPIKNRHHFYRRDGELLTEFAVQQERVESASIPGFWIRREWLNSTQLPMVSACLEEILPDRKRARWE